MFHFAAYNDTRKMYLYRCNIPLLNDILSLDQ